MSKAMARNVAELKQRIARLERQLEEQSRVQNEPASRQKAGSSSLATSRTGPVMPPSEPNERILVHRAERLLDELLDGNPPRLVSYSEAYRRIFGDYDVWRNAVHAPAVVRVACRTSQRQVARLTIRLDALVVGKETRRPARGHFRSANYSEADWIQTFGTWPLLA